MGLGDGYWSIHTPFSTQWEENFLESTLGNFEISPITLICPKDGPILLVYMIFQYILKFEIGAGAGAANLYHRST